MCSSIYVPVRGLATVATVLIQIVPGVAWEILGDVQRILGTELATLGELPGHRQTDGCPAVTMRLVQLETAFGGVTDGAWNVVRGFGHQTVNLTISAEGRLMVT